MKRKDIIELIKIINQIEKYDLKSVFENEEEMQQWILRLNNKQKKNFLDLDIDPCTVDSNLIINEAILKRLDYKEIIGSNIELAFQKETQLKKSNKNKSLVLSKKR